MRQWFKLDEYGTSLRTELLAGLTTFLTMGYIIFVNPAVLSTDFAGAPTGLDSGAVLLATCAAAAIGCVLMGLYAGYPIGLAPGMGNNFFFVSVVMQLSAMGIAGAWRVALAIVFISGVLFLLLSVFRVREAVIDAMSGSMRNGIAVGIGLFIAFIGLRNGGVIQQDPGTLVALNPDITAHSVLVFLAGLVLIAALSARRIRGAIVLGILGASLVAFCLGEVEAPSKLIGLPHIEQPALGRLDFRTAFTAACIPFIVVFVFMDLFDTVGTLVGVSEQAGFIEEDGTLPRAGRALTSDAVATVAGAAMGTSTVTSYIESAAGVEEGGRTGLTAVVVGGLFLLALVFSPLIAVVAAYPPITAPALLVVGTMMMRNVGKIDWSDITESLPSFLIVIGIPLTYSIADGLALGFVAYPVVKVLGGRGRDVKWVMGLLALCMVLYFLLVRRNLG